MSHSGKYYEGGYGLTRFEAELKDSEAQTLAWLESKARALGRPYVIITVRQIARDRAKAPSTISRALNGLREKGWLKIEDADKKELPGVWRRTGAFKIKVLRSSCRVGNTSNNRGVWGGRPAAESWDQEDDQTEKAAAAARIEDDSSERWTTQASTIDDLNRQLDHAAEFRGRAAAARPSSRCCRSSESINKSGSSSPPSKIAPERQEAPRDGFEASDAQEPRERNSEALRVTRSTVFEFPPSDHSTTAEGAVCPIDHESQQEQPCHPDTATAQEAVKTPEGDKASAIKSRWQLRPISQTSTSAQESPSSPVDQPSRASWPVSSGTTQTISSAARKPSSERELIEWEKRRRMQGRRNDELWKSGERPLDGPTSMGAVVGELLKGLVGNSTTADLTSRPSQQPVASASRSPSTTNNARPTSTSGDGSTFPRGSRPSAAISGKPSTWHIEAMEARFSSGLNWNRPKSSATPTRGSHGSTGPRASSPSTRSSGSFATSSPTESSNSRVKPMGRTREQP